MSELLRVATLGTGQVPAEAPTRSGAASDALVDALPELRPERALLLRAGALAMLDRAATLHPSAEARLGVAGAETRPRATPRQTERLEPLFHEGEPEVLREALERLDRAGLRLAEEQLPLALSSQRDPAIRAALRPLLGERGRWLAGLRESYAWALEPASSAASLPDDHERAFPEGTAAQRVAWLAIERRLDPARARQRIAEGWKQESVEQRLAWIEVIAESLAPEDEPLLTSALGDRSKTVVLAAARALLRLPGSALRARAVERVDALVTPIAAASGVLSALGRLVRGEPSVGLRVELPEETFDPAWTKEGLVEAPHQDGRRQWWLRQRVAAVPPRHFLERTGLSVPALLGIVLAHEHADLLLDGLSAGTLLHGDASFVAPLWDAWLTSEHAPRLALRPLRTLGARLAREDAEPRMFAAIDAARFDLLDVFPAPWPAAVARRFLGRLAARPAIDVALRAAALAIPIPLLPDDETLAAFAEPQREGWVDRRLYETFRSIVGARRAIAQEIPA